MTPFVRSFSSPPPGCHAGGCHRQPQGEDGIPCRKLASPTVDAFLPGAHSYGPIYKPESLGWKGTGGDAVLEKVPA